MTRYIDYARHVIILLSLLIISTLTITTYADRCVIPWEDIAIRVTDQKVIIAWNGTYEIMILSTDIIPYHYDRLTGKVKALEIIPLPSVPEVEKGSKEPFNILIKYVHERVRGLRTYTPYITPMASTTEEGITIIFHKKIDVHDITVVEVNDTDEFIHWLKNYIMRYRLELPEKLNSALPIIEDYVNRGYNYFVIDIIELEEDLAFSRTYSL